MSTVGLPDRFLLFNEQQVKNICVVVEIEGLPVVLTNRTIFTRVLYGDPGLEYGEPGLVYGGLRRYRGADGGDLFKALLDERASLTVTQKLEPEQGRASISTLSLAFLDQDSYMTQVISPGVILDEILGRNVSIKLGYEDISYPQDFFEVFRGVVAEVSAGSGIVTLALADSNIKRRQELFFMAKTTLNGAITDVATTLTLTSASNFPQPLVSPGGLGFDETYKQYVKIDDEWIEYTKTNSGGGTLNPTTGVMTNATRGARGTAAAAHDDGATVEAGIEISGHAIDLALKIMLSGGGPAAWIDGIEVESFGEFPDATPWTSLTDVLILPVGVDVVKSYGVTVGDYVSCSGSLEGAGYNDAVEAAIVSIEDYEDEPNRLIRFASGTWYKENGSPATIGFKSKYSNLGFPCYMNLSPMDVDVAQHEYIRDTFLSSDENSLRFFITESESSGKAFLEKEIYLPIGCYSLTRRGKLSMGITKPPIADSGLVWLDQDNILNAKDLRPSRAMNGRNFYNEVQYFMDADDEGKFRAITKILDSDSISLIGISSVLKIESKGSRTDLSAQTTLDKIAQFLLSRYKKGAVVIAPKVNWEAGATLEVGDVVAVDDNGDLQIPNFANGERNLYTALFEVIERSLDMKTGNVSLKLISGIPGDASDRFATIAPSSKVGAGSTASTIIIEDSYGAVYPFNEKKKWQDYIGETILVHADDWSYSDTATLLGFDPSNNYAMLVSPALSFTPAAGDIIELNDYPTSTDPNEAQTPKAIHAFLSPTVDVTAGTSGTVFEVDPADAAKILVGCLVRVHSEDYTNDSDDVEVTDVDYGTGEVTVETDLGFTPSAGDQVDLIGFADGGAAYRWI